MKDALATLVEVGASAAHRPLQLRPIESRELVEACVERARGQAVGRQVSLVAHIDPDATEVSADRAAVLQVLAKGKGRTIEGVASTSFGKSLAWHWAVAPPAR